MYKKNFSSLHNRSTCIEFALTGSRKQMCENMAQQKAITMDSFYRISYPEGLSNLFLKITHLTLFHAPSVDRSNIVAKTNRNVGKIV